MNNLLLGSGEWHWEGWTSIDADPASGADYICTLPPLPESVLAQCWDQILAAHFIEHLYQWEAEELLRQCYECLSPGGTLTLEQPNIEYCARVLLGQVEAPPGEPGQHSMWGFYGSPKERNPLYGHHWGYSPKTLAQVLTRVGFSPSKLTVKPGHYHSPVRDFIIEAVR